MILYHASDVEVSVPDLIHSRDFLDFGVGFYLTTLREQAVKYGDRFKAKGHPAILNTYDFNGSKANLDILTFDKYDGAWLDFIGLCRKGMDQTKYDAVEGGIANDRIFRTIDLYFAGDMSKEDALRKLMMEQPNHQICLRTEKALSLLKFVGSEEL